MSQRIVSGEYRRKRLINVEDIEADDYISMSRRRLEMYISHARLYVVRGRMPTLLHGRTRCKAVVPCQNKIILNNFRPEPPPSVHRPKIILFQHGTTSKIISKNFRLFQCFILTWNHI